MTAPRAANGWIYSSYGWAQDLMLTESNLAHDPGDEQHRAAMQDAIDDNGVERNYIFQ